MFSLSCNGISCNWVGNGLLGARTYYDISRLHMLDQWWHWLLLSAVVISLIAFVAGLYRRDGVEVPTSIRWLLTMLRVAAFAGLLIFFLKIEKRTEQKLVKNSRSVVLVDTSQSMGLVDPKLPGASAASNGIDGTNATRLEQVKRALNSDVIDALRKAHDVAVYRFDQQDQPSEIAFLPRTGSPDDEDALLDPASQSEKAIREVRAFLIAGTVLLGLAAIFLIGNFILGARVQTLDGESWALLLGVFCLIVSGVFFAVSHLRQPQVGWRQVFGNQPVVAAVDPPRDNSPEAAPETGPTADDWHTTLTPQGQATRLGDALEFLIDKERGGPIAAITVFTDGNSNTGSSYSSALAAAQEAEIRVHFVGMGTSERPANVRMVDIEAPQRVYPGDEFQVKAHIQAYGLSGKNAQLELSSTEDTPGENDAGSHLESQQIVTLPSDGEVATFDFRVTPEALGKRLYTVKIATSERDLDPNDNAQTARVQVVDRKNKILLLAGGPTREYRFVRNLFHRDKNSVVDVLLQSAPPGAAQESNRVLETFPETPEELFEYDCVIAFDPDWEALNDQQIDLLDRWVAQKSGGLILIAGPVFMPEWTTLRRDTPSTQTLKTLYPVTFFSRTVSRLARGQIGENPRAIEFTDSGTQSRFLWIDEDAVRNQADWAGFEGVYQAFPVRSVKPGATVLAYLEKNNETEDQQPVFLAEQFYGSGRILYLGTGELWRLRSQSVAQFEQLYTKIVRHVSQGRLLRDSTRGVLMLAKDRCLLGDTIVVRAALTDKLFRPLTEAAVKADLVQPDGVRIPLELRAVNDATQAGNYMGQFVAIREGNYRVELPVPGSDQLELLARDLKVRAPQLEIENPQRNDAIMNEFATASGGVYYTDLQQVTDTNSKDGWVASIVPQDQQTYLPGTPDQEFQLRLMGWLMTLICGTLCLEWLVRRLNKLA